MTAFLTKFLHFSTLNVLRMGNNGTRLKLHVRVNCVVSHSNGKK